MQNNLPEDEKDEDIGDDPDEFDDEVDPNGEKIQLSFLHLTLKQARKLIVGVIGGTILLIGIIMFVTPGPALVIIPIGLAVLATEFLWARRLLRRMRQQGKDIVSYFSGSTETADTSKTKDEDKDK